MSLVTKCYIGLAAALGAAVVFTAPAMATHQGFQHSNNCVAQNVMIDFNEDDIGRIIDLLYENCGNTAETTLGNSLYRRVSNYPNPDETLVSEGNARRDMVVFDTKFRNSGPGNNPCKIGNAGGGGVDSIEVSAGCIEKQIGVDFDPPVDLEADLQLGNPSAVTITGSRRLRMRNVNQVRDAEACRYHLRHADVVRERFWGRRLRSQGLQFRPTGEPCPRLLAHGIKSDRINSDYRGLLRCGERQRCASRARFPQP